MTMDDTTHSRISDAAATRKRRSSILKSQRPPRTPFCELEFNVSTPPDTTKSRRVSFSKRTGVAEFVTNEATTTWKNFYEEHNKSLDSLGNNSDPKGQPINHLGRRIFDQQFEEVDAVDLIGTLTTGINISSSINNVNFTQQLECTDNKLTAPQNNFELSAFTEQHSKLFGDDLAITIGEQSHRIDINFSTMQQIGEKDDLDEIQKDLQRQRSNVVCHGPFSDRQNLSEYIEVDLNMTQVAMRQEESDMSITDTIHSPKVQDLSKSVSIEKKINVDKDWVMDKENIVVNPYVTPRESVNFAVNEESDKVLVFDGKKLIVQTEEPKNEAYRQTLLPDPSEKVPQRKTIVLNCNDDLPNFVECPQVSNRNIGVAKLKQSVILDDMSFTQPRLDETQNKQKTVIYDDNLGDISVTQAVPSNIIDKEKRSTTDCNIPIAPQVFNADFTNKSNERRKTILYENEACNISMTQALPANIIIPETNDRNKSRTIVFDDSVANISITQAIPNIVIKETESVRTVVKDSIGNISLTKSVTNGGETERRRTVVFENDTGNISVTQAIPSNIILPLKLNATSCEDSFNISMTQAVPTNILIATNSEQNRRGTVVYENDTGNLSITQAVPSYQLIQGLALQQHKKISSDIEVTTKEVLHVNKEVGVNKNRTVVFENDDVDISMTQGVNLNQVLPGVVNRQENLISSPPVGITENKRKTIVFEDDAADISVTQAVSNQVIQSINKENQNDNIKATDAALHKDINKRETLVFDDGDISMTQAVVLNQLLDGLVTNLKENVTTTDLEVSMTQAIPANIIYQKPFEKRRTVVFDDSETESKNILMEIDKLIDDKNEKKEMDVLDISMTEVVEVERIGRKATQYDDDMGIITHEVPHNLSSNYKKKKIVTVAFDETANTSTSKPIPAHLAELQNEIFDKSLKKERDPMFANLKNEVNDIAVYQTVTVMSKKIDTAKTEKGDSESQESIAIPKEEGNTSSTKITKNTMSHDSAKISSGINIPKKTDNDEQEDLCTGTPIEAEELIPSETNVVEQKESVLNMPVVKPKTSILNDLLDMSSSRADIANKINDNSLPINKPETQSSDDNLFYITKDSDEDILDKNTENEKYTRVVPPTSENTPLPIEYKDDNPEIILDLKKTLNDFKSVLKDDHSPKSKDKHHKTSISLDTTSKDSLEKSRRDISLKMGKSFKMANDTNELLNMLSDLTDNRASRNLDPHSEESEEAPEPIFVKGHLAIENKEEIEPPPRKLSFAPKRQSIVMSREDLLNNISMATAALQKSRFELDASDSNVDLTRDTPEPEASQPKSVRLSAEVVKTLNFEEDSVSEVNESKDVQTPLRKTAFGEISYMKETKSKVIPNYLEDVSDGIKELMDDLVKPMADELPFETTTLGKGIKKRPSTCSTQVQANLVTSSQTDISNELYSNPESTYDVQKLNSVDIITDAVNRSMSRALSSPINVYSEKSSETELASDCFVRPKSVSPSKRCENIEPGKVLIFDHHNPLNNVLIPPIGGVEVHRYNPGKSIEKMFPENDQPAQRSEKKREIDSEVERIFTHYHVENIIPVKTIALQKVDAQSITSNNSMVISLDQATDPKVPELKDIEVNTAIAMKVNMELLENSSSLTLVDDTATGTEVDANINSCTNTSLKHKSPVKVIFKLAESCLGNLDSDINSNDGLDEKPSNPKKRVYSSTKRDKHEYTLSTVDTTPKPVSKMQKRWNSTEKRNHERPLIKKNEPDKENTNKSTQNFKNPETITAYSLHVSTMSHIDKDIRKTGIDDDNNSTIEPVQRKSECDGPRTASSDGLSSLASRKSSENPFILPNTLLPTSRTVSNMDWQPKSLCSDVSLKTVSQCESAANLKARIDSMPFVGGHECEWDCRCGDSWSFLLLRRRLRLTVRFEEERVGYDTGVVSLKLERTIQGTSPDKAKPLVTLCVSYAAEAMRFHLRRGCGTGGAVAARLRALAATARVAARWAQALHDARARLAYTITEDGWITLKVANTTIPAMWEVEIQVELVVDDAMCAPWPRATVQRVARVVPRAVPSDVDAGLARAIHATPPDWGHAPRTLWKIFKYLKHKKRDDSMAIAN